jgi:hypothetical protein
VRRVLGLLVLLAGASCAGRWLSVDQPIRPLPNRPPRDYRVVLRNDSVLVLRDAVVRNDSLVEVARGELSQATSPATRGVDLADAVQVEAWQPGGERIGGGVALGIVAAVVALLTAIGLAVAD